MRRDRWFALSVVGAALTCLACLTPVAVLVLGTIGLGAWTGRRGVVFAPLVVGAVLLAAYRYWIMWRKPQ